MSSIRLSARENILSDPARVTEQMYADYLTVLGRGWVAEWDGEVVGFCYADHRDSSIWALFVAPEYEGQGVGKRLLAGAVDWLFELGKECVQLSTGANTRAARFYLAQGWVSEEAKDGKELRYRLLNTQAQAL